MILAAADPGVASNFTIVSALSAIGVGMSLAALLVYAAWTVRGGRKGAVERWLESRLARRAARALDRGDEQIRRAVLEHEDAYARRPQQHASVPKQLERTRRP